MPTSSDDSIPPEMITRLLAGAPIIRNACDLDLMLFLHRHPRTLLTSEQLAGFIGYPLRETARALDTFIEAGLLARTAQQSMHAARMFVLLLDGPQGEAVRVLLESGSTRAGRQRILDAMKARGSGPPRPSAFVDLRLVKSA